MSIGYQDTSVSAALLAECEEEKQQATGWGRYAKFKVWLHYANLDRWQRQGHHFHYLTDVSEKKEKLICTCGLFLDEGGEIEAEAIDSSIALKASDLELDRIQITKGHRSLDDFKSLSCALLVNFVWRAEIGEYLWTAFCQECGDIVVELRNEEAKAFVNNHNQKHLGQL